MRDTASFTRPCAKDARLTRPAAAAIATTPGRFNTSRAYGIKYRSYDSSWRDDWLNDWHFFESVMEWLVHVFGFRFGFR